MTLLPPPSRDSYNIVARGKGLWPGSVTWPLGETVARAKREARFEVYGEEMLEKVVAKSGSSGRVYLPPDWIGKRVKVIRVD